jgi:hypothetical protein
MIKQAMRTKNVKVDKNERILTNGIFESPLLRSKEYSAPNPETLLKGSAVRKQES